jgi:hypothetical protein
MTGWRLWTVRAAHTGAITALSLRWASSGEYGFGIAAGGFAIGLAVTFLPDRRRRMRP